MVATDPTRVARATGRRSRTVPGVPKDAIPPSGVTEWDETAVDASVAGVGRNVFPDAPAADLPDEDEYELEDDGVNTAPPAADADATTEAATAAGRKLISGGNPDEPARIPREEQFAEDMFVRDSQLDRVAMELQDKRGLPTHDVVIHFRFKAKGGMRAGKPNTGGCVKLAGPSKHFAQADYLVWIAADHARDMNYTAWQLEAELYHQMLHMAVEENEDGDINRSVRGHDAELFLAEYRHYGPWRFDLEQVEKVVKVRQTSLF